MRLTLATATREELSAAPRALQLLQVTLAPGAQVKAEPGAIAFCSDGLSVDTRLDGGVFRSLSRVVAGASLFTNTLTNTVRQARLPAVRAPRISRGLPRRVSAQTAVPGFVALHPSATHATVVPLDLRALGGAMLCQRDAFLASLGSVDVSAAMTKRLSAGLLGGEGMILQRLSGSGLAFITAAGTIVQKVLAPGESVLVDTGCVVALQPSVDYSVAFVGSVRRALFAGEGPFMVRLTGGAEGGLIVLQSVREHGTGNVSRDAQGSTQRHRCVVSTVVTTPARCLCRRGSPRPDDATFRLALRNNIGGQLACTLLLFTVMVLVVGVFALVVLLDNDEGMPQYHRQPPRQQRPRFTNFDL